LTRYVTVEATRRLLADHRAWVALLVSTYPAEDVPADAPSSGALADVDENTSTPTSSSELWRDRSWTMRRTA
jgi:hypothetical protein